MEWNWSLATQYRTVSLLYRYHMGRGPGRWCAKRFFLAPRRRLDVVWQQRRGLQTGPQFRRTAVCAYPCQTGKFPRRMQCNCPAFRWRSICWGDHGIDSGGRPQPGIRTGRVAFASTAHRELPAQPGSQCALDRDFRPGIGTLRIRKG